MFKTFRAQQAFLLPGKYNYKVYLKVIFFFPDVEKYVAKWQSNHRFIKDEVIKFYKFICTQSEEDNKSIQSSVSKYPSILVIALRTDNPSEAKSLSQHSFKARSKILFPSFVSLHFSNRLSSLLWPSSTAIVFLACASLAWSITTRMCTEKALLVKCLSLHRLICTVALLQWSEIAQT